MSLSGNTEKINELLSKINALPDAGEGGSGGASVETCTVTVQASASTYRPEYISYTALGDNGKPNAQYIYNSSSSTKVVTLQNVLCGSAVTVDWAYISGSFNCTNCSLVANYNSMNFTVFSIDAVAGGAATIYLNGGGGGGST